MSKAFFNPATRRFLSDTPANRKRFAAGELQAADAPLPPRAPRARAAAFVPEDLPDNDAAVGGISNVKALLSAWIERGGRIKLILFFGHTRLDDPYICFSQWFPNALFSHNGNVYKTSEHYMMSEKARLFGDVPKIQEAIDADTPAEAKRIGRQVEGFDPAVWDKNAPSIVSAGNVLKFSQNPAYAAVLRSTGNAILAEAAPRDRIWGIGRGKSAEGYNPTMWNGKNYLGFALMRARNVLNKQEIGG